MDNKECNIIVFLAIVVQETEISQGEELDFFLKIDFYTNKTLHQHWHMG